MILATASGVTKSLLTSKNDGAMIAVFFVGRLPRLIISVIKEDLTDEI